MLHIKFQGRRSIDSRVGGGGGGLYDFFYFLPFIGMAAMSAM